MALTDLDIQYGYEARQIEQRHRGWLVMWSLWHRTFTAFSCFASTPLLVDAPTAEQLMQRLRQVELQYSIICPGGTEVTVNSTAPMKAVIHD